MIGNFLALLATAFHNLAAPAAHPAPAHLAHGSASDGGSSQNKHLDGAAGV